MLLQQPVPAPPDAITPTIIEVVKEPARSLNMIDVAVAAFGLTGVIMAAAVIAGLVAGVVFVWYRRRGPASTIEARGHEHNFFRI